MPNRQPEQPAVYSNHPPSTEQGTTQQPCCELKGFDYTSCCVLYGFSYPVSDEGVLSALYCVLKDFLSTLLCAEGVMSTYPIHAALC